MAELTYEAINVDALSRLIKGLDYNIETDEFSFKGKQYRLRSAVHVDESLMKDTLFFVNIQEPSEIVNVLTIKGIPVYDGFNKKKVDRKLRQRFYDNAYYKKVTAIKRREKSQELKLIKEKEREALKAQRLLELEEEKRKKLEAIQPIKCKYCGKLFKPTQKTQIFCSRSCYKRASSRRQYLKIKNAMRSVKECPVCGEVFLGTPRMKYCSKKCRDNNAKERRKESRQFGKV